jgi:hypothetical protein
MKDNIPCLDATACDKYKFQVEIQRFFDKEMYSKKNILKLFRKSLARG